MGRWIGVWWLVFVGCGTSGGGFPTAVVQREPFDVTLTIQGELKAVRKVIVSAPQLGGPAKVTWVADEGSRVEAGDELLRFDGTELTRRLEEAQNQLEVAQTKIEQKQAQLAVSIAEQQDAITKAELSLQRAEMRITDSESVPRVDRESAKIDVRESNLSLDQARRKLRSTRLEGEAAIELLRLEATQAQRKVDKASEALAAAVVKAETPGLVILPSVWKGSSYGPVAVGDQVWPGRGIIELPDMSEMLVEAWVHEVDAAKVAKGQSVSVVVDAHPEPPHPGEVDKVADLAVQRDNREAKYLKVDIGLDETEGLMKPGMTVRAELLVDHLDEALTVPLEAVFVRDGTSVAYVTSGFGGAKPVELTLGIRNEARVVVLEGLDEGDRVALVDPTRLDEATSLGDPQDGEPSP